MTGRKRTYIVIGILAIVIVGYFVVSAAFPKDLGRFPIFVIILLLDIYLWLSIRKAISRWKHKLRLAFSILYWFPLVAVVTMGIASVFVNLYLWKPHFATLLGGSIFILYLTKLFIIVFFLLADFISISSFTVRFLYHKKKQKPCPEKSINISRARFLKNIGLFGGGVVLSGMIIGAVRWAYDFRVRKEYLEFPMMPRQLEGVKIIQISDLHLGSWTNKMALQEAVDLMNAEEAEFIFFTGDLVNFLTREAYKYKSILKQLKARFGVFAVLGNHDYGDYVKWDTEAEKEQNLIDLEEFYKEIGWHLLRNENRLARVNNIPVAIVGVENWSSYDRFPRYGDMDKALEGSGNALFKILLSHDPTHWDSVVSTEHQDVNLTLSGHTHGFQFGVELKNFRWSPAQYMYKRWAGLYANPSSDEKQYLYVNRGLGMIGYPGRIGILPEITVIELGR